MYTALYRKWRPMTFDDVISQPHITTTLSRQIAEGKTAHAYLFTGSRGTGKTTCARIFAKAVNCLNPHDGKPCLECEICRAADSGTLNDIIEIDAASNTGVEDIRDLRESAAYTPELCRFKVYIIDEVHMLSNQAFNALLKIMEEPPEHVKFILATTEIHKVPATIISRCQRFDFRRIRQEDITERLLYISEKEGVTLEREAAQTIARISDGAMRDALSLLDQCIAYSDHITAETVSDAAGIAGRDSLFEILGGLARRDAAGVLKAVDYLYSRSKDMARLCDELVVQLRNIMLIQLAPKNTELINALPGEIALLSELAGQFSTQQIFSYLDILESASVDMQRAVSKRTEFEMAMIKICSGSKPCSQPNSAKAGARTSDSDAAELISALSRRVSELENELRQIKRSGVSPSDTASQASKAEPAQLETTAPPENVESGANREKVRLTDDMLRPFERWDEVLDRLTEVNPGCAGALKGSRGRYYENILLIEVQSEFFLNLFKKSENARSLRDVVREITGQSFSIRARQLKEPAQEKEDKLSKLIEQAKKADIPFDIN